jgi:hypothetical protein
MAFDYFPRLKQTAKGYDTLQQLKDPLYQLQLQQTTNDLLSTSAQLLLSIK